MSSASLFTWKAESRQALSELRRICRTVNKQVFESIFASERLRESYVVILASSFQKFCRDLHSECVSHLVTTLIQDSRAQTLFQNGLLLRRDLDRGNATPENLEADFKRLGINLWKGLYQHEQSNRLRNQVLAEMNMWRNAIAHQSHDPSKLGESAMDPRRTVSWFRSCRQLAFSMDQVLGMHLSSLTGSHPWGKAHGQLNDR